MNIARQCETLFNDVNDLGAGVAAIGELLRFSQDEAYPSVLNGVGIVLHHLGKTMAGLNTQFLAESYQGIRDLEVKEEQDIAVKQAVDQILNATDSRHSTNDDLVSAIVDVLNVDVKRTGLRIVPTSER
jgi:hypothetical protein